MSSTFFLFSQPYLNQYNQCYDNIITLNSVPDGPLKKYIRRIQTPVLSQFKENQFSPSCALAIGRGLFHSLERRDYLCNCHVVTQTELPDLICFLTMNGYNIERKIAQSIGVVGNKTPLFVISFPSTNYNKVRLDKIIKN